MKQYLDLMHNVFLNGAVKEDRTGTGTKSLFGQQMRFDLSDGKFPLVTTKKCHLKSIIHELLWFLQGDTNVRYLKENGVSIWDDWVLEGTGEYRDLTIKERSELVSKKGEEALEKWVDHIRELRGDFLEGMAELTAEFTEKHHLFLDELEIPRRVLVAGELGPVYGSQWRKWEDVRIVSVAEVEKYDDLGYEFVDTLGNTLMTGKVVMARKIDQIADLIKSLTTNADSRRHMVSAWNPAYVEEQALPPCHSMFQFYTAPLTAKERGEWYHGHSTEEEQFEKQVVPIADILDRKFDGLISEEAALAEIAAVYDSLGVPQRRLSCQLYQRSADVFLGAPFNIASYALLTLMVAQVTNMVPGEFIWTGGDCHIYTNHMEQAALQLGRAPLPLPTMKINPDVKDLLAFKFEDFELVDYQAHPHIAGKVAV